MDEANLLTTEQQKQSELSLQLLEIKHDLRNLLACEISESDKSQALVWTNQAEAFLNGIASLYSAQLIKRRNKLLKNIVHLRNKLMRTTYSVYQLPLQSVSRSRQPASKLVHSQSVQQQVYLPQISHSAQILDQLVQILNLSSPDDLVIAFEKLIQQRDRLQQLVHKLEKENFALDQSLRVIQKKREAEVPPLQGDFNLTIRFDKLKQDIDKKIGLKCKPIMRDQAMQTGLEMHVICDAQIRELKKIVSNMARQREEDTRIIEDLKDKVDVYLGGNKCKDLQNQDREALVANVQRDYKRDNRQILQTHPFYLQERKKLDYSTVEQENCEEAAKFSTVKKVLNVLNSNRKIESSSLRDDYIKEANIVSFREITSSYNPE